MVSLLQFFLNSTRGIFRPQDHKKFHQLRFSIRTLKRKVLLNFTPMNLCKYILISTQIQYIKVRKKDNQQLGLFGNVCNNLQ
jgi:hypothetical protein